MALKTKKYLDLDTIPLVLSLDDLTCDMRILLRLSP